MHDAAGNAEDLALSDLGAHAFDRPGERAAEAVDGLLVAVVAVRRRGGRTRRHVELEDRDGSVRRLALQEEPDRDPSDPDLLACRGRHLVLLPLGGKVVLP